MSKFRKGQFKDVAGDNLKLLQNQLLAPPPKLEGKMAYKGKRNYKMSNQPVPTQEAEQLVQLSKIQTQAYIKNESQQDSRNITPKKLPEMQKNFESAMLKSLTPRRQSSSKQISQNVHEKSGAFILQQYKGQLTSHEQQEILQYNRVSYWGQIAQKQYNTNNPNNGYDDAKGDYLGKKHDHVAYRYETQQLLGEGSFGKVYKAYDHFYQRIVAIKIVKNKKRFHRQGLVEVRLLETIRKNDPEDISNCLKLTHSFYFRQHLCIVFEMYSINLYELLVKYDLRGIKFNMIRDMVVQSVNALCYLHNLNIIHADIKPENILLVNENSTRIKVIDIGSGCFKGQTIYTYIQSRFYRAPEVILGLNYSIEIDVWSMGCVFAELLVGLPIFPGENEFEQFGIICEFLGMPPASMLQRSPRLNEFVTNGKLRTKHRPGTKSIRQFCNQRQSNADFIDLLEKMLVWEPTQRLTPHQLMQHQFIKQMAESTKNVGDLGQGAVGFSEKKQMKDLQKENEVKSLFTEGAADMGFSAVKKKKGSSLSEKASAGQQTTSSLPGLKGFQ